MLDNLQNIELEAIFLSSLIQINKINEISEIVKVEHFSKESFGTIYKIIKDIKSYENIELINDSKETAPSKRLDKYTNGNYCGQKTTSSINILKNIDDEISKIVKKDLDSIHNFFILQTIIGLGIIIFMIVIGFLSVNRINLQVRSLKKLTLEIANNKDLSVDIRVYENDEMLDKMFGSFCLGK